MTDHSNMEKDKQITPTDARIRQVCRALVMDLDPDKLAYVIQFPDMVDGIKKSFIRYGIEYNEAVHQELVEIVESRLMSNPDIEYEWNERQYDNFVKYKPIAE